MIGGHQPGDAPTAEKRRQPERLVDHRTTEDHSKRMKRSKGLKGNGWLLADVPVDDAITRHTISRRIEGQPSIRLLRTVRDDEDPFGVPWYRPHYHSTTDARTIGTRIGATKRRGSHERYLRPLPFWPTREVPPMGPCPPGSLARLSWSWSFSHRSARGTCSSKDKTRTTSNPLSWRLMYQLLWRYGLWWTPWWLWLWMIHIPLPLQPLLIRCPIVITRRETERDIDREKSTSFPLQSTPWTMCHPNTSEARRINNLRQKRRLPPALGRTPVPFSLSSSPLTHSLFLSSSTSSSPSSSSLIPIIRSFPQSAHGPFLRRRRESTRACCDCSCSLFAESLARPCAPDRPLTIPAAAPFTTIFPHFSTI